MQKRPFLTMKKSHGILNEESQWSSDRCSVSTLYSHSKSQHNSDIPKKSGAASFPAKELLNVKHCICLIFIGILCRKVEESFGQQMSQSEKGHSELCLKIFLHTGPQVAQWYTVV